MRKLILVSLTISSSIAAQTPAARPRTAPLKGSLEQRLAQLIDVPPFNRATWGIYVVDDRGRVLYQRNADRFSVPASNTKLVVTAAAAVLLPADYRVTTSLYVNGRVDAGVLRSEEHTSELQSPCNLVCRLLLEKKKKKIHNVADKAQTSKKSTALTTPATFCSIPYSMRRITSAVMHVTLQSPRCRRRRSRVSHV